MLQFTSVLSRNMFDFSFETIRLTLFRIALTLEGASSVVASKRS